MGIDLRRIETPEDLAEWTRALMRSFHAGDQADERIALNQRFAAECRTTVAEVDGVIAGTFRSFDTVLTLPGGGSVNVDAITGVTVQSTHRRRGVLTSMMHDDLAETAKRGQPAAILLAAEHAIYGRYGFGVATRALGISVDKSRTTVAGSPSAAAQAGRLEFVSPAELVALGTEPFDRMRATRAGEISRSILKWEADANVSPWPGDPWKGWQVVSRDGSGVVDGYVQYHVDEKWDSGVPQSTLWIDSLVSTDKHSHERIWRYLFGIDLIATIRAREIPFDDPIQWMLTDPRAMTANIDFDGCWLRPLDSLALLRARTLGDGAVTLMITDAFGYANTTAQIVDGSVTEATSATPDIVLDVAVFATLILGTERATVLARAGLIEGADEQCLASLDSIFSASTAPFISTHF